MSIEQDKETVNLVDQVLKGEVSRREFIKRAAILGMSVGAISTILSACGGAAATPTATKAAAGAATAAATAAGATKEQITIAFSATPIGWDPDLSGLTGANESMYLVQDGLVRWKLGPTSKESGALVADTANYPKSLEPHLAESWKSEGNTHIFSLRKGVMSHAGNEMTADDVKWTYDRAFKLQGIGIYIASMGGLLKADDVKVIDKYTVSFTLSLPPDVFFKGLCINQACVLDSTEMKKHATADDPYATKWGPTGDAGFGRYKVTSLEAGKQLTLESYDKHYMGPAPMKRLVIREVPSSANRLTLVDKGEVDVVTELLPRELETLKGKGNVRVWNLPSGNMGYYEMGWIFPPFDNQTVRQAVCYAVPYDQIINEVYRGFASPATSVMPSSFPGYKKSYTYTYDVDKAMSLLKQAGFGDGFSTEIGYNSDLPLHEQLAVVLQTALAKVKIKATLKGLTSAPYLESLLSFDKTKKYPIEVSTAGQNEPDAYYWGMGLMHSKSFINPSVVKSPELDAIIEKLGAETDAAKRNDLAGQMQDLVNTQATWATWAETNLQLATGSAVKGVTGYLTDHFLNNLYI